MLDNLISQWTGQDQLLLSRNPNGVPYKEHFSDVRDIARGLLLAIEKRGSRRRRVQPRRQRDHRLGRSCPSSAIPLQLADRFGVSYAEARLPTPVHYTLDLSKIQTRLGFAPQHDLDSVIATAQAIRRGEKTDVLPTGIRYGKS